jgi:hypothetical protein
LPLRLALSPRFGEHLSSSRLLMRLLFVGGVMNLLWIAALAFRAPGEGFPNRLDPSTDGRCEPHRRRSLADQFLSQSPPDSIFSSFDHTLQTSFL